MSLKEMKDSEIVKITNLFDIIRHEYSHGRKKNKEYSVMMSSINKRWKKKDSSSRKRWNVSDIDYYSRKYFIGYQRMVRLRVIYDEKISSRLNNIRHWFHLWRRCFIIDCWLFILHVTYVNSSEEDMNNINLLWSWLKVYLHKNYCQFFLNTDQFQMYIF
jgi:hypothetical protein